MVLLLACTGSTELNKGRAEIVVDPEAVDFEEVVLGEATELAVVVRNEGYGPLDFTSIGFSDLSSGDFGLVSYPEAGLGYNDEGTLLLSYAPTTEGTHLAVLELGTTDPDRPLVEIPVAGAGVVPHIDVDPETLDFGFVDPGGRYTLPIQINASGSGALVVEGFQWGTGAESVAYTIELPDEWTTPMVIPSGVGHTIDVTFHPPTDDDYSGHVLVLSNDPESPYTAVRLRGNLKDDGENDPPVVEILDPNEGEYFLTSDTVTLRGQAVDDGEVTSLLCAWYANGVPVASGFPNSKGVVVSTAALPQGTIEVLLRCVDPQTATGEDLTQVEVWPSDGPFEYTFTGGDQLFDYIAVDDDLTVLVNGAEVYADNDNTSSTLPPFTFEASVGDVVEIVGIDENPDHATIDPTWIHFGATARQQLTEAVCLSSKPENACYDADYPLQRPNVFLDTEITITIP